MFIKINDIIINADHIAHIRKVNVINENEPHFYTMEICMNILNKEGSIEVINIIHDKESDRDRNFEKVFESLNLSSMLNGFI